MVLKMYPGRWTRPAIVYEHSILDHLAEQGFAAVRLNRTHEGETSVEHDHRWFAVFDFEQGFSRTACFLPKSGHRRLLEVAGRTLGELHHALDGFEPDGEHHLGFGSPEGGRGRDLPWLLKRLEELPERNREFPAHAVQEGLNWLAGRAPSVAERLVRLDQTLAHAGLPRVVIHGDYGIHNLLYRSDGSAIVHDFELARLDWRLIDVLAGAARLQAPPLRKAFIAAYRSAYEVVEAELTYLNEVWQDYRLRGAVHSWHNFSEFGGERRVMVARRRIEQADAAREQGIVPWM
jgi:Ser/Thr protein kinase RdoA (MazF antagonist)